MRSFSKGVLTVEQTAGVLGIGRQTAYAQCRLSIATEGREGIPCRRICRRIHIYRAELEAWLCFTIEWPPKCDEPAPAPPVAPDVASPAKSKRRSSRRYRPVNVEQATLPF